MNKYISFENERPSESGKTSIWDVMTEDKDQLGDISWYGRWRQYSFTPRPYTVFERGCLRAIADFCENATRQHRRKGKVKT